MLSIPFDPVLLELKTCRIMSLSSQNILNFFSNFWIIARPFPIWFGNWNWNVCSRFQRLRCLKRSLPMHGHVWNYRALWVVTDLQTSKVKISLSRPRVRSSCIKKFERNCFNEINASFWFLFLFNLASSILLQYQNLSRIFNK